ncbi:MAG: hypothetical protein AB1324_08420 [Candidatus Micrarchaeota archaeon]
MAERIPPRPTDDSVPTGSQFMDSVRTLNPAQFEERVMQEIARGNVPDFMRPENFRTMSVTMQVEGREITAAVRVCPDYLAIGSNDNHARVPISPILAQRIARRYGFVMPTQRLVDAIDAKARSDGGFLSFNGAGEVAARVTDSASGQKVSARWNHKQYGAYEAKWMESPEFALEHSRMTSERVGVPGSAMLSGHKKDIVYHPDTEKPITNKKGQVVYPGRVAIYHQGIQPFSTIHHSGYFDYSHGVRFLLSDVRLTITERDGSRREETMSMRNILNHEQYYRLFSPIRMDIDQLYLGQAERKHTGIVPSRSGRVASRGTLQHAG